MNVTSIRANTLSFGSNKKPNLDDKLSQKFKDNKANDFRVNKKEAFTPQDIKELEKNLEKEFVKRNNDCFEQKFVDTTFVIDEPQKKKESKFKKLPSGAVAVETLNAGKIPVGYKELVVGAVQCQYQNPNTSKIYNGTLLLMPSFGITEPVMLEGDPVKNYEALMAEFDKPKVQSIGY